MPTTTSSNTPPSEADQGHVVDRHKRTLGVVQLILAILVGVMLAWTEGGILLLSCVAAGVAGVVNIAHS